MSESGADAKRKSRESNARKSGNVRDSDPQRNSGTKESQRRAGTIYEFITTRPKPNEAPLPPRASARKSQKQTRGSGSSNTSETDDALDSHNDYDYYHGSRIGDVDVASVASRSEGSDSSWENWWITSPLWKRKLLLFSIIVCLLALAQLLFAIVLFVPVNENGKDPYLCSTSKCRSLSDWVNSTSALHELNPCQNFLDYSCVNRDNNDRGEVAHGWFANFARVEDNGEHGEGFLAKILTEPDESDILSQRIVKYYQVCTRTMFVDQLDLGEHVKTLIQSVLGLDGSLGEVVNVSPSLVKDGKKDALQTLAVRMINYVGDFAFFNSLAPREYPVVPLTHFVFAQLWLDSAMDNVSAVLPMIYTALEVPNDNWTRYRLSKSMRDMMDMFTALASYRLKSVANLNCTEAQNNEIDPDFEKIEFDKFYQAAFNDSNLVTRVDVLHSNVGDQENFVKFKRCWNAWMYKLTIIRSPDKKGIVSVRTTYGILFSLRLLIDSLHEIDDDTAEHWRFHDKSNHFFTFFRENFYDRLVESRCFQSLTDNMGYYPTFRYFNISREQKITSFNPEDPDQVEDTLQDGDLKTTPLQHHTEALEVMEHARVALFEQFRPAEEGGMSFISSRFRKLAYEFFAMKNSTVINIPMLDDDPTFPESPTSAELEITDTHVINFIRWRRFIIRRRIHYWKSGAPIDKLVWFRDFYMADLPQYYEAPRLGISNFMKIPATFFSFPFWNSDISIGNYAGARLLASKAWLALFQFYVQEDNQKLLLEKKLKNETSTGVGIWEGSDTDGEFKSCFTVFNDVTRRPRRQGSTQLVRKRFDSNYLAFRHGRWDIDIDGREHVHFPIFYLYTAWKATLAKFEEDIIVRQRDARIFLTLKRARRNRIIHEKLHNMPIFDEKQLFFVIGTRQICRHPLPDDPFFVRHVVENLEALRQLKEFSDAFMCPPNAPMNPIRKCFI